MRNSMGIRVHSGDKEIKWEMRNKLGTRKESWN